MEVGAGLARKRPADKRRGAVFEGQLQGSGSGGQTGANAFLVRDALGHRTLAMTGRYVNRDADPLRELADRGIGPYRRRDGGRERRGCAPSAGGRVHEQDRS